MFRSENRAGRLFKRWLLIQVLFLLIMLTLSIGLYLYAAVGIRKQLLDLHEGKIQKIGSEVDAVIKSSRAAAMDYVINPLMQSLVNTRSDSMKNVEREFARLVDDIKQTNTTNSCIAEIILYFPELKCFISSAGVMDSEIFTQIYSPAGSRSESLISVISARSIDKNIVPVVSYHDSGNGMKTGAFVCPMLSGVDISGRVAALVDLASVETILSNNKQHSQDKITVSTAEGKLIFSSSKTDLEIPADILEADNKPHKISLSGVNYYCMNNVSEETKLVYSMFIPENLFYERYFSFQRTALLILLISGLIGIALSYYITLIKYLPIFRMAESSDTMFDDEYSASSEDELEKISHALKMGKNTKLVLNRHENYIADSAWRMILDGNLNINDASDYIKKLIDISEDLTYTTIVLEINDSADRALDMKKLHIHITNEMNNLNLRYFLSKDGCLVLIFEEAIDRRIPFFEEITKLADSKIVISVGSSGKGTAGIASGYQEAVKNLMWKIMPGIGPLILPQEEIINTSVTIPYEKEIQLSGLLQSGDGEKAINMLDELISIDIEEGTEPFAYKVYLYYLASSIIRSAEYLKDDEKLSHKTLEQLKNAFTSRDHQYIIEAMKETILTIADAYKDSQKSSNKVLNARLVKYIDQNLNDPQLSADSIAAELKANSAYIRKFFNEQNGISLWDYINMRRVESAQEKLKYTSKSIVKVSQSCGYVSISTFTRAFKKFTGMTPGQYRKLNRLQEE